MLRHCNTAALSFVEANSESDERNMPMVVMLLAAVRNMPDTMFTWIVEIRARYLTSI